MPRQSSEEERQPIMGLPLVTAIETVVFRGSKKSQAAGWKTDGKDGNEMYRCGAVTMIESVDITVQ